MGDASRPYRRHSIPGSPRSRWIARPVAVGLLALAVTATALSMPSVDATAPSRPCGVIAGAPVADAAGPLAIESFTAVPSAIVTGQTAILYANATGGSPPYSYSYIGLPYGCHSANRSDLACRPGEVRTFTIRVTVNDVLNATANASVQLRVGSGAGGPPTITTFFADPAAVSVLQKTTLHANATSSSSTPSASLTYLFLGLPPGCASFNGTSIECVPTSPGSFHIRLQVSDAFGSYATALSWLNVTGGGSSSAANTGNTPSPWLVPSLAASVAVVALVSAVLAVRARRGHRKPPAPGSTPP